MQYRRGSVRDADEPGDVDKRGPPCVTGFEWPRTRGGSTLTRPVASVSRRPALAINPAKQPFARIRARSGRAAARDAPGRPGCNTRKVSRRRQILGFVLAIACPRDARARRGHGRRRRLGRRPAVRRPARRIGLARAPAATTRARRARSRRRRPLRPRRAVPRTVTSSSSSSATATSSSSTTTTQLVFDQVPGPVDVLLDASAYRTRHRPGASRSLSACSVPGSCCGAPCARNSGVPSGVRGRRRDQRTRCCPRRDRGGRAAGARDGPEASGAAPRSLSRDPPARRACPSRRARLGAGRAAGAGRDGPPRCTPPPTSLRCATGETSS